MRKLVIMLAVVGVLGLVANQALAWGPWGQGGWRPMGGYCGAYTGAAYQNSLNDTAKPRQELAVKEGEYDALMAQPNPDPKRTAQVSQEIARLQEQIQTKAQISGIPAPGPYAYGPHRGGCAGSKKGERVEPILSLDPLTRLMGEDGHARM